MGRWSLPVLIFAARRLGLAASALLTVTIVVMGVTEILPGDACTAYLGEFIEPDVLASCRQDLGLDQPAYVRYAKWVTDLAHGNLGVSFKLQRPVTEILPPRIRNTVLLAGMAAIVAIPLALGLGVFAALHRDRAADLAISGMSVGLMAVPEFVTMALLVLVFALKLKRLPAVTTAPPTAPISHLLSSAALPATALVVVITAHILRISRAAVIEVLDSGYIEIARLRGVPPLRLALRHVLPSASAATVGVVALTMAWLLGGVVLVEQVANYPGLGTLMVQAVYDRDIPLLQAVTLVFAATYIGINLCADLFVMVLIPKLRPAAGVSSS